MARDTTKALTASLLALGTAALCDGRAAAQQPEPMVPTAAVRATVVRPQSGRRVPHGAGRVAYTNFEELVPDEPPANPQVFQARTGVYAETPASLACIYRQVAPGSGCSPTTATALASGGSRLIAIVDAYDHPTLASNLATFSRTFGLPPASFSTVYAAGRRPAQDPKGNWEVEEALDVEVAHSLAPGARLVLVEAASESTGDLLAAVDVASTLVAQAGGGEVSMSWGTDEFAGERSYDYHFTKPGVVYFAAAGDDPGDVLFPAVSANVVAVGGTTVTRNANTGTFRGEATWTDGGGGASAYVPSPSYQAGVRDLTGRNRATPDLAADGNPQSGVNVYSSIPGSTASTGWLVVGGTSASTPIVAALVNAAGTFQASSASELQSLYARAGTRSFRTVTRGTCGPDASYDATLPWSACVGLGSPEAGAGVPAKPNPF